MKKLLCLVIGLGLLSVTSAFGQDKTPSPPSQTAPSPASSLTKFDLDFPGGTPAELIAAIERGMGHSLNAIVPAEYAKVKIPALKMRGVTAAELFQALMQSSRNAFFLPTGAPVENNYGFSTTGLPSDNSVWNFHMVGMGVPHDRISRFYLLTPYLERGLTVDDITTAIHTGWKMLGDEPAPALSYHPETKLLIVVGRESQIHTVEGVLGALDKMPYTPPVKPLPPKS